MNLFSLAWANIWSRPLPSLLVVLLTAFGVFLGSLVTGVEKQLVDAAEKSSGGVDMVVGAKGSPLQLVLANIFHADNPTGNIPLRQAMAIARNPLVKKAVPLAYGDYYGAYRILGTDTGFISLYNLEVAAGDLWGGPMEVVLGARVAEESGVKTGSLIRGAHGITSGELHAEPYRVAGILKTSGTVADHLVLTSLATVWHSHEHDDTSRIEEREITALLLKFRSGMGVLALPGLVNRMPNLQAALPAVETDRLLSLAGKGFDVMRIVAALVLIISTAGIFFLLLNALLDRKYEMALLRVLGAGPAKVSLLVFTEALLLTFTGALAGIFLAKPVTYYLMVMLGNTYHHHADVILFTKTDLLLTGLVIFLGLLSAVIPAVKVYRIPIAKTLLND